MTMQEKLSEYARLAVVTGLAVIPGQEVMISASVDVADFVQPVRPMLSWNGWTAKLQNCAIAILIWKKFLSARSGQA